MIKNNRENSIEIIPEKKEEEDESEERRDSGGLNIKNFKSRNSSVQFIQAKYLGNRTSLDLKQNVNKNKYPEIISQVLVTKIINAKKLIKYINNKQNKSKIDEKIQKFRDEIPNIKSKYEIYLDEEKKKNGENNLINEESKKKENKNSDNEEQVKDWFEGIFS